MRRYLSFHRFLRSLGNSEATCKRASTETGKTPMTAIRRHKATASTPGPLFSTKAGELVQKQDKPGRWMVRVGDTCSTTNVIRQRTWTPHEDDPVDEEPKSDRKLDEFTGLALGLKGYGVVFEDKEKDLSHLVQNFTAPALASALRDREETLHICAVLIDEGRTEELKKILRPFHTEKINERRLKKRKMFLNDGFKPEHIYMVRKYLHRLPRQLPRYAEKRASVMLPMCNSQGVASVLFQYRSDTVRSHKNQVCFPGGVVDNRRDANIVETCLREMEEEMGIRDVKDVCGVLRCDWGTIAKLVGVSVTPVVGWMGDIENYDFSHMNPDEVQAAFTIPIEDLLRIDNWNINEKDGVPAYEFSGGPHPIWGLTAFLLYRFLQDVLRRYRVYFDEEVDELPSETSPVVLRKDSLDAISARSGGKCYGEDD